MRVIVGMSGGVDSSVAAALLARAGHDVIGVSLQLIDHSQGGRVARCCSPEDFLDARRVASQFGFPYYVVNEEESFRHRVLDDFAAEYRRGRTPNPCVRCNTGVKFATLCRLAPALDAAAVATGHYARRGVDPATGAPRVLRGRDRDKDQSYFLFDLTPEQLAMARFPLGDMTKEEVRRAAAEMGLATAGKPESQDVCFVEGGDYRGFLRRHAGDGAPEPGGEMVDPAGRVVGRHDGLSSYTVGQRRGLGLGGPRRLYVVRVEASSNRVVVGGEEDLLAGAIDLSGVRCAARQTAFRADVRIRHRHEAAPAVVTPGGEGTARVVFDTPVRGAAPGQAAVFYDGDVVLGGGWIEPARPVRAVLTAATA